MNNSIIENSIIVSWNKDIFRSSDNSFCVALYKNKSEDDEKNTIVCKGANLPGTKNISYQFNGHWIEDKKYGRQFNVISYEEKIGTSKNEVIDYLCSGIFKGLGKKSAEKIYEAFGHDAIRIIAEEPERLLSVKGITEKQIKKIKTSYEENHIPNELVELLIAYDFSATMISKIYKYIKQNAYQKILNNPYILCDINGISFQMADRLLGKSTISEYSHERLLAAEIEAVKSNFFTGKVGITMDELLKAVVKLTGIRDVKLLHKSILSNLSNGNLCYRKVVDNGVTKQYIYTYQIKKTEESLAHTIVRNLVNVKDDSKKAEEYLIKNNYKNLLDEYQYDAVIKAFSSNISIITGGPGTGKTTTTKVIETVAKYVDDWKDNVLFLAPTGRAARRMTESTGREAFTIHNRLKLRPLDDDRIQTYQENDEDEDIIKNKTIVIDEFSMVDMMLALALFEKTENCRYIIVGDPNQLPSVGAGNVLKDLIDCKVIPVCKLKYVHRQGEGSSIKENANGMQEGETNFKRDDSFVVEYGNTMKEIEDRIVETYLKEQKENKTKSIAVLNPYKNYDAGMYSINNRIQAMLNPSGEEFKGTNGQVFRVGDPVMHVKENTDTAVNGDVGVVCKITLNEDGDRCVVAEYDNGKGTFYKEYTSKEIEQLNLAYAMTIHKSQGSEYNTIITLLTAFHRNFVVRNIPYTAITRAKEKVYFFTDSDDTIKKAIENNSMEDRHTLLSFLIREECKKRHLFANAFEKKEVKASKNIEGQLSFNFVTGSLQTV